MGNIIMRYPLMFGNPVCDGEQHQIKPRSLSEFYINNERYLIMEYQDLTYQCECQTILKNEGGKYYKVPLKSYDDFEVIYRRCKPISIDTTELEGVSFIDYKKPLKDAHSLVEIETEKNTTEKGPYAALEVFVDDDGNFYITIAAASLLFDNHLNKYSQDPSYILTASQLEFIKSNFVIKWQFIRRNKINHNNMSDNQLLVNALTKTAEKSNMDANKLIEKFIPVYYIALQCDDSVVRGGLLEYSRLLHGYRVFLYNIEISNYQSLNGNGNDNVYDYLKSLVGYDYLKYIEDYGYNLDELKIEKIIEEGAKSSSIPITDIPDYVSENGIYKFVGMWDGLKTINSVTPLEPSDDLKETLSSCLLGYKDSVCTGSYYEHGYENYSSSINIKNLRNEYEPSSYRKTT